MVAVLLALGLFIVLLQLGVMALVRRLAQQIEIERARIDKLERAAARAVAGMADFVPTLTPQAEQAAARQPRPAVPASAAASVSAAAPAAAVSVGRPAASPVAASLVAASPVAASTPPDAEPKVDPTELRGEMLGLMRQLVDQGLSVREIASRCGLSEAEAELMLSLHGSERA